MNVKVFFAFFVMREMANYLCVKLFPEEVKGTLLLICWKFIKSVEYSRDACLHFSSFSLQMFLIKRIATGSIQIQHILQVA